MELAFVGDCFEFFQRIYAAGFSGLGNGYRARLGVVNVLALCGEFANRFREEFAIGAWSDQELGSVREELRRAALVCLDVGLIAADDAMVGLAERGKGKVLSRLNFDKPAPSHATPKPERPGDDGNESKNEVSDRDQSKMKARKDKETPVGHKADPDKTASSKAPTKAEGATPRTKDLSKPQAKPAKPAKPDGKFKSSERIEDSDEEAEAAD